MSTKLTPKQRDALDLIRSSRTKYYDETGEGAHGNTGVFRDYGGSTRHPYRAEFGIRTVRAFEQRGLVELEVVYETPAQTVYLVRITDAGRAALGDWVAAERSGEESA